MEELIKGDVVVIPFPYTNLIQSKNRPALVISNIKGEDIILCQITSQPRVDKYTIRLTNADFVEGTLAVDSTIRPNLIFTIEKSLIKYIIGKLHRQKILEVEEKLVAIIKS
jgi:mRNA interferase MazF